MREDGSEVPPATDIFAAFKGWAVGRYSVVLTRGEVLDALGEEWQEVDGKICDAGRCPPAAADAVAPSKLREAGLFRYKPRTLREKCVATSSSPACF